MTFNTWWTEDWVAVVLTGIYCESVGIGSEVIERPSGIRVPFLAGSFKKEVQVFSPLVLDIFLWVHSLWINTEYRMVTFYSCRIHD